MKLVNVGCGGVYHPAWINLDFSPVGPEVRRWDIRQGLPFDEGSVDAIYHSHVLEHLDAEAGRRFVAECRRVLKPRGLLRVAVPDLEGIARAYIEVLDTAPAVDPVMHDWLRLELFDQLARSRPGGAMLPFLQSLETGALERVRTRIGMELDHILSATASPPAPLRRRLARAGLHGTLRRLRYAAARWLLRFVGGTEAQRALDVGTFRRSGEVHLCMYDAIAVNRLLVSEGFCEIMRRSAGESAIPGFDSHALEMENGHVRKPDSLFMEARRHD